MEPGNLRLLPVYSENTLADLFQACSSPSLSTAICGLWGNSDFKLGNHIIDQPEQSSIVHPQCFGKALPFVGCRF